MSTMGALGVGCLKEFPVDPCLNCTYDIFLRGGSQVVYMVGCELTILHCVVGEPIEYREGGEDLVGGVVTNIVVIP